MKTTIALVTALTLATGALAVEVGKPAPGFTATDLNGHAGTQTVVVVPCRSLARVTGSASDLRGKVRFGLARIGWDI